MSTPDDDEVHVEIMSSLFELITGGSNMSLPPKIFIEMGGKFTGFVKNQYLIAKFPNRESYLNPVGFMQGGMITAAIDNTVSPLSYTVGPPNVTKEISTKFKRPVTVADRFVEVTATISELNETSIKLSAIVRKESGKVAAVAEAYCVFINQRTHGSDC